MTTKRTTRRLRRTKTRRTKKIAKLSSLLTFWNHKLKPNSIKMITKMWRSRDKTEDEYVEVQEEKDDN